MNELDPNLKRLLKWAHEASLSQPAEAPFGFSGRVVASGRQAQRPTLLQELHRRAWCLSLASLALMVCGGLIWITQRPAPPPTGEFSSALGFLASNITR